MIWHQAPERVSGVEVLVTFAVVMLFLLGFAVGRGSLDCPKAPPPAACNEQSILPDARERGPPYLGIMRAREKPPRAVWQRPWGSFSAETNDTEERMRAIRKYMAAVTLALLAGCSLTRGGPAVDLQDKARAEGFGATLGLGTAEALRATVATTEKGRLKAEAAVMAAQAALHSPTPSVAAIQAAIAEYTENYSGLMATGVLAVRAALSFAGVGVERIEPDSVLYAGIDAYFVALRSRLANGVVERSLLVRAERGITRDAQTFPGTLAKWRVLLFLQPINGQGSIALVAEGPTIDATIIGTYTNLVVFYNALHGANMLNGSVAIFLAPPGYDFQSPWRG